MLENGRLRAELGRDGLLRSLVELSTDREALAGPGNVMQLYDDRPTAYDAWDVDPFHLETVRRRAAGHVVLGDPRRPAARRGGDRAADRPRQHDAPGGAAGRRLAPAGVPLRGRLARVAHDAQGAVPGRRPRAQRDVPDAVRARRAADALLDQPRPGALRGARPPLRRPVRARLRRGAADRLQVRLLDLRQPDADQPAALAADARPGRRRRPSRVRLRGDAARRRLARGRRGGRGGALRDADPLGAGGGGALVLLGRRPQPGAGHGQARRGLGRAGAAAVRVPRRARHRPPAGRRPVHRRRGAATCWRTRAPSYASRTARSSSPTGRTRSSACCWCNNGV